MTITEDASTPAIATGTGTGNLASSAFTPPSGTLVIAMVGLQFGPTGPTVTVTDSSGGGTWTVLSQIAGDTTNFGMSHIACKYFASSPGSITVTAAFTNLTGGRFLAVRVLNGASSSQTGATATLKLTSAGTNCTFSITTTTAGAQVYGIVNDQDSNPTMVAASGATTILGSVFSNGTDIAITGAFKATAAVGSPGATTLGVTLGASNKASGAMAEILPGSPPAADTPPPSPPALFPHFLTGPAGMWIPRKITEQPAVVPLLWEFNADAGTDGATITAGDLGSGRTPDAVTIGTGASAVYSASASITGANSAVFDVGSTSSSSFFQWNLPAASAGPHYAGVWIDYPSTFGASASIFSLNTAGTAQVRVQITATDKIRVLDQAGVTVYTSTLTMTPGNSYFLSMAFLAAPAGTYQINIYDQNCVLVESTGPAAADFAGTVSNVRFGSITNQTNTNWRPLTMDQLTWRNDRMPRPVPLQVAGPFTVGTSFVGGARTLRQGSASTAWSQAPTDDAGLTDTVSKAVAPQVTDDAGLTDTTTVSAGHLLALTDDAGLSDTIAKTVAAGPTDLAGLTDTTIITRALAPTDDAGLTDTAVFTRAAVVTDDAGLTDTSTVSAGHLLAPTDDAGLTDTSTVSAGHVLSPTDDAGLSDTVTKTQAPAVTDDAGLTDTVTVVKATFVSPVDDAGLTDTITKTVAPVVTDLAGLTDTAAFTVAPVITDQTGLTDTVATTRTAPATDDAGLTDTATVSAGHVLSPTDDAGLTDTAAFAERPLDSDDAGLTDTVSKTVAPVIVDDAGLTDTATVVKAAFVTPTDDAGLTDSVAFQVRPLTTDDTGLTDSVLMRRSLAPTDDAGLTDTATVVKATFVTQTDDAGLTDLVAKTAAPTVTDDAGLGDTTVITRRAAPTDDTGLTDTATVGLVRTVTQTDDTGLTDSVTKTVAPAVTDLAGLTDTTLLRRSLAPVDDTGLTDTAVFAWTQTRTFTDSAGLTDTYVADGGVIPFTARIIDTGLTVTGERDPGRLAATNLDTGLTVTGDTEPGPPGSTHTDGGTTYTTRS